jgi:hypothetical protein
VAVDGQGNVITTGQFRGTADFDPGAGTVNLTSVGGVDLFVSKLDPFGNFVWVRQLGNSTGVDQGFGVAVDGQGSVYTTGGFQGTADFDPGPGTFTLTSAGAFDVFMWKLTSGGNFVWARSMGGSSGTEAGYDVAVDGQGNVYTAGYFQGTADFDPGAGTVNLTSAGFEDVFVSKLDPFGNFVWAKRMGDSGRDEGHGVAVDGQGSVYTTGFFEGKVDFDPGAGTFSLTSAGSADVFVSKLGPNTTPTISGEQADQLVGADATIAPFSSLNITDPDDEAAVVTVVIQNGVDRGDFTPASSAGWTRTVKGTDIRYTRGFTAANVGAAVQAAVRALVFDPRDIPPGTGTTEKTVFTVTVDDSGPAVTNGREISVVSTTAPPAALAGAGASKGTTVRSLSMDDAPWGASLGYKVRGNQALVVNAAEGVLGGVKGLDAAARLTARLLGRPKRGRLRFNADGSFRYTPAPNFRGAVTFQVVIADGQGGFSDPIMLTIRVLGSRRR